MLTIYQSYVYGVAYPLALIGATVGSRVTHATLGAATIIQVESENWFVVEFDNKELHRRRVNIEGSSYNGIPPVFARLADEFLKGAQP